MGAGNFGQLGAWGFGGGSGGGSGPTTQDGLLIVAGVCGQIGGPVAGEKTWTPDGAVLVGATMVNVAIVNNSPELSVTGSPYNNFTFDNSTGTIDRDPNIWVDGDTIILWYKPAP